MAENNDKARLIEKIKKLMALAKDKAATPNEAASAARQAEIMMRKYNLEMSEVIQQELKNQDNLTWGFVRSNMFKNNGAFIKKVQDWPQWIAVTCAELYDCHVSLRLVPSEGHVIAIFGYTTDVEVCRWVYEYLLDCVRRASLKLRESDLPFGITLRTYRNEFRRGMALEISHKLRDAAEMKAQQDKASSTCTALVVAKRAAVAEKFGDFSYSSRQEVKIKNRAALEHGREEGRKININPNPITDASVKGHKQVKGK